MHAVCIHFSGNQKSENYEELIAELIENHQQLGCLINLKLHFLKSHLQHFPDNLEITVKNKAKDSTKILSQIHKEMERRYQGRWDKHMMADFCWMLKRKYVMKDRKRKRNPLHRSFEDKKFRKSKRSKRKI